MAIVHVTWGGFDGSLWVLDGYDSSGGVMLTEVGGMVGEINRATVPRSSGVGATVSAKTYPPMGGTLKFIITADEQTYMEKGEVYRAFTDTWKTQVPGVLTVVDSLAGAYSVKAFAARSVPVTKFSPWSKERPFIEFDIEVFTEEGIWPGELRSLSNPMGTVLIPNRGDISIHPTVRWVGTSRTVTLGNGEVIYLPPALGGEYLNLSTDPSTGFVVTKDDGSVDSIAWKSMRGKPVFGEIKPGEVATFGMSAGVELLVREYLENPWR